MASPGDTRERPTILFVNHVGKISGAERSLLAMLERLDRGRFRPVVACPAGPLVDVLHAIGIETRAVPVCRLKRSRRPLEAARNLRSWFAAARAIRALLRAERIDVVHANSTTAHLCAGRAAGRSSVPCVWHCRDLVRLGVLGRMLGRWADRVVAISDAVGQALRDGGVPSEKVRRIYNGLDADAFTADVKPGGTRGRLGLLVEHRVAVMVAQFAPWKRHMDFLGAFAQVAEQMPSARALVVGDDVFGDHPALRGRLESLCRHLEIADRVTFTGFRTDVAQIIANSDVLVMPSLAEPFGRVALEAMAVAVPVIGTAAGGLPEVVEDGVTGLLVPPHDPNRLAEAMEWILRDRRRSRRMGRAGRERVRERFGIAETVRQVETLYDELLAAPKREASS